MADVDVKTAKSAGDKKTEAKKAAQKAAAQKMAAKKGPGFFKSVSIELKKVHWPDKETVVKYTGVVFGVVIVLGTVIWLLDTAFSGALSLLVG